VVVRFDKIGPDFFTIYNDIPNIMICQILVERKRAEGSLPGNGNHFGKSGSGRIFVEKHPPGGAPAMADMAYREVYTMNPVEARKRLIQTFRETSSIALMTHLL